MATFDEIKTYAKNVIQDNKYNHLLGDFINQAQAEIAGGMLSTLGHWLTPPLPDLLTIDTVNTSTSDAYVSMPTDFQRCLQFAAKSDGTEIDIAESFLSLVETYPLLDQSGSIVECCEFGGNFYYQGIPTASEAVTIHYYKNPTDMSADSDTPDGIPSHLHKALLGNYTIWKVQEIINKEDIIHETNRQIILSENAKKLQIHRDLFLNALRTLELFIPYNHRNINLISENA